VKAYEDLRQQAEETWQAYNRPARPRVTVLLATCTIAAGADETLAELRSQTRKRHLDVDVGIAGCNGLCYAEPLVEVARPDGSRVLYQKITADKVSRLVEEVLVGGDAGADMALAVAEGPSLDGIPPLSSLEFWALQERRLMANTGIIDPENIDHYIARGGYEGLAKVLDGMSQEEVIKWVTDSGLWGRGGAGFPAGRKWDFLRTAKREPKFILCNADEGDPGAWVNRILMEGDPQGIIEGILIAAYATGSSRAFIYIRDEYPLCIERMQKALDQARERGLMGDNVLGTDFSCRIDIIRGAGSYVCGEETGLISSIEDARGMPKIRPPYPAQSGVFGQPSNVNNVETLANVPLIMRHGVEWYTAMGTERNRGTKMFSVSGNIQRVGALEVPFGMAMSRLLMEAGGGPPEGRSPKAIQIGGPLLGVAPASALDFPLEPQPFQELGIGLGGGGLVLVDDSHCMVDLAIYLSWFCEDESCGRCTTCHGGTQRLVEIWRRIGEGKGRPSDIDTFGLLSKTLVDANCIHGQWSPVASVTTTKFFTDEVFAHITDKVCPAKVCRALIRYEVSDQRPELADAAEVCPTAAIVQADGGYEIDQSLCIRCDACREVAPEAIRVVDAHPS
jgi:NADH:ubiquinone oxidoreductase subunit F (NADH-binding)/(2Fe-2S) ferredoxin/ferredoxin